MVRPQPLHHRGAELAGDTVRRYFRAGDPAAGRVLRKVRVNARPWATFTVDGGATQYETISTIELAPGPHRLHFSNPQLGVERDVTIQVPADRDLDHVEDLRR